MSYTILKSNGSAITILGSALNTTDTSLQLIGRAFRNYGSALNTNLVNLLENFSNNFPPSNPIPGQLWFNNINNELRVRNNTNTSWVLLGGAGGGSAPIFTESVIGIPDPVAGFIHNSTLAGIFSTGITNVNNLEGSLSGTFSQGLNRGLNIGGLVNAGVYGTSGLHFGIGSSDPTMVVKTSITSIFGNLEIIGNLNNPNPNINITPNTSSGFSNFRFNAGSTGNSSIIFSTSNNDIGYIHYDHSNNDMSLNAGRFSLSASNSSESFVIKNINNLRFNLETFIGNENKIGFVIDNSSKFTIGLDINGLFSIDNSETLEKILIINPANNNIGIGTVSPSEALSVNGNVSVSGNIFASSIETGGVFISVSGGGSYFLPSSAGLPGQALLSNGDNSLLYWGSFDNSFITDVSGVVGIFTEEIGGELTFRTNGQQRMKIDSVGDVISNGTVTVSGLTVSNPNGLYSLPISAGNAGEVLVSNGNFNTATWQTLSGLSTTFIEDTGGFVGFFTETIFNQAIVRTDNTDRLVITGDGRFGLNESSPGFGLQFNSPSDSALKISIVDSPSFIVLANLGFPGSLDVKVSGEADSVEFNFGCTNAILSGDVTYSFFKETDVIGIRSVVFYEGDGSSVISSKIGVANEDTYFNLTGGNFGIGVSASISAKLTVGGEILTKSIKVSSSDGFYTLPTSAGINGQIVKINNNQMYWDTPYQSNEDGYELERQNQFNISNISLSASSWLFIPLNNINDYEKILFALNDLVISANASISDLRVRVITSSNQTFTSAYSSYFNFDIVNNQTGDNEWLIKDFFTAVSGISRFNNSFKGEIYYQSVSADIILKAEYGIFEGNINVNKVMSGLIPNSEISEGIIGIIVNSNNEIRILSGWINIAGVIPKDVSGLSLASSINFTP